MPLWLTNSADIFFPHSSLLPGEGTLRMREEKEEEEKGRGTWKHAAFHVATTIATPAAYAPLPFALASLGWPLGSHFSYFYLLSMLFHSNYCQGMFCSTKDCKWRYMHNCFAYTDFGLLLLTYIFDCSKYSIFKCINRMNIGTPEMLTMKINKSVWVLKFNSNLLNVYICSLTIIRLSQSTRFLQENM